MVLNTGLLQTIAPNFDVLALSILAASLSVKLLLFAASRSAYALALATFSSSPETAWLMTISSALHLGSIRKRFW